jgi:hypothetical protein
VLGGFASRVLGGFASPDAIAVNTEGIEIPAVTTVDEMVHRLHQRRACPFQILRELAWREASESFGEVSRRGRT